MDQRSYPGRYDERATAVETHVASRTGAIIRHPGGVADKARLRELIHTPPRLHGRIGEEHTAKSIHAAIRPARFVMLVYGAIAIVVNAIADLVDGRSPVVAKYRRAKRRARESCHLCGGCGLIEARSYDEYRLGYFFGDLCDSLAIYIYVEHCADRGAGFARQSCFERNRPHFGI